jgi:hypothetical protein
MAKRLVLGTLGLLLGACAPTAQAPAVVPVRATDFKSSEIRQPVVFVQVAFGAGQYEDKERRAIPEEYEGALLEGLNARAVLTKEVRVSVGGRDATLDAALARARALGADHAIFVEVRLARGVAAFCKESRRSAFQAQATLWAQRAEVARASDGAVRLRLTSSPTLAVYDLDADCDNPRDSRRRSPAEAAAELVNRLLARLFGP